MLLVISDGWPLLLSIKKSLLFNLHRTSVSTHKQIRKTERERESGKKNRKDMQMASTHKENVTLDVLAICVHFSFFLK
jgi:hypothetical protein